MLVIGFTNIYYTLWNVTTVGKKVEQQIVTTTNYTYYQNLSFDFEEAKRKAGTDNFDPELKGSTSFNVVTYKYIDSGINTIVDFGKYYGKTLQEISELDLPYLIWLAKESRNKDLKRITNEHPAAVNYYIEREKISIDFNNFPGLHNIGVISNWVVTATTNLKLHENYDTSFDMIGYTATLSIAVDDIHVLRFKFTDKQFNILYYDGYAYGLPLIKGKAKRIKNKELFITGQVTEIQHDIGDRKIITIVSVDELNI